MFKFNFAEDDLDTNKQVKGSAIISNFNSTAAKQKSESAKEDHFVSRHVASEITLDLNRICFSMPETRKLMFRSSHAFIRVLRPSVSKSSEVGRVVAQQRDVLPGVYEGGLALWECALDLISWLDINQSKVGVSSAYVLELGCGFGLPGIWSLQKGCKSCIFQDLNADVLHTATGPHIVANLGAASLDRTKLFSGDWFDKGLCNLLKGECNSGYDLILSAETLYTPSLVQRLVDLLLLLMKPKTGVAVIAAKRYYFGTELGGGTTLFCSLIKKCAHLNAEVVRVFENGASNIREVVLVTTQL